MIFFGWGFQTTKNAGPVFQEQCTNCKNEVPFELRRTIIWFTLFFIPVIPYNFEYWIICPVCSYGYKIDKNKFKELFAEAQMNLSATNGNLKEVSGSKELANGQNNNNIGLVTPKREEWPQIALEIAKAFEQIDKFLVQSFSKVLSENGWSTKKGDLLNLAKIPIKAFDLLLCINFIIEKGYFKDEKETNDFVELLQANVFGTFTEQCDKFYDLYAEKELEERNKIFIEDILLCLAAKKGHLALVNKALSENVVAYIGTLAIATATQFGDEVSAKELDKTFFDSDSTEEDQVPTTEENIVETAKASS